MRRRMHAFAGIVVSTLLLAAGATADPLRVVATTPDLGDLAAIVGGPEVEVTSLVKGPQDPHAIEPRPSLIRTLHRADVFAQVGMELERGWVPPLLRSARNPDILPGGPGHVDASRVVAPLEVPAATADRSGGDVHPYGNPHYLTDPVNGVRVAALLGERFAELRPGDAAGFTERARAFGARAAEALVGPGLVARHGADAVLRAVDAGTLAALRGDAKPEGWLAALPGGVTAVEDHQYWIYFAHRFGIELLARLEPFPGVAPSTRHLGEVVELVRVRDVPLILASVYFDPRHARWVAERTGASVVLLAHQVGARPGADDYLGTIDANVRALREALDARGR